MNNVWNKYKCILLLLINMFPFALDVIFYSFGAMADLYLFLPIFAVLTVLNYLNCKKVFPYILYQMLILVCIIGSGYASTYLYYHNISNDSMTPIVGGFMVFLGVTIDIITTVVTAPIKAIVNKKRMQRADR